MKTGNRIVAAAVGGALCLAASSGLSRGDDSSILTMIPMAAKSLDIDSKHIVGFFQQAEGRCRLTLMINDAGDETIAKVSRMQLPVDPGRSARIDTSQGSALAFGCEIEAQAMSVHKVDRFAAYPEVQ